VKAGATVLLGWMRGAFTEIWLDLPKIRGAGIYRFYLLALDLFLLLNIPLPAK